jgi:hypothetical protein
VLGHRKGRARRHSKGFCDREIVSLISIGFDNRFSKQVHRLQRLIIPPFLCRSVTDVLRDIFQLPAVGINRIFSEFNENQIKLLK